MSLTNTLAGSGRIEPFKVDLSKNVPRMLDLVKNTKLPEKSVYSQLGASAGIDLDVLKQMQREWIDDFDWKAEEEEMNSYNHFTTTIEGLKIHFIHERSGEPDAIPLLLLHGWPGSFLEFLPVVKPLTQAAKTSTGKDVSFDIIIPSLPGYAFSQTPPPSWTTADTARIFHALMADVLGYKTFSIHGTDWGCVIGYTLYEQYTAATRAAHFSMIPFFPMLPDQLAANGITLTPDEQFQEDRFIGWNTTGNSYFFIQTTKPTTIGLALQDNPIGQLAWIAQQIIDWSDPRAGTAPSVLTHKEILRFTSLYFLTESFLSSVFIYSSNSNGFRPEYTKAPTDAPMLYSNFKYNNAFFPRAIVEKVGNLVRWQDHDFGGHFAGVDNPPALISDIRDVGNYWHQ
ncbi:Epoxide hydrolase [Ilyonectria robusta]